MNRKHLSAVAALALVAGSARADFSYEQTTKITGGMMAGMMKVAGAFSKQAREPMQSTVILKGDRMAMTSARNIQIIDLAAETMTDIDLEKKTYSVITFADFGRAMQKISEKMGQNQKDQPQVSFKADVKQTGATRNINGLPAKETILTLTMEGQNQKSGEKAAAMNVVTDMWLAPNLPGYEEVKSFYARMAQKLAFAPGMGGMGAMMGQQAGMAKRMSELYKEASKIDGVPVLQVIRMGGAMQGMSEADMAQMQQAAADAERAQQQQAPPPTAGEVAGSAATGAAANRMGRFGGLAAAGGIGGLGGFGRKKKQQQEEQVQAQTPPPAAPKEQQQAAKAEGGTPPGTLMELTTELTAFSSAPVDVAKVSVPAGFKQVEHAFAKELK